jgi:hypothetical protein
MSDISGSYAVAESGAAKGSISDAPESKPPRQVVQGSVSDAPESDWTFEHIRTLITWLNYSNVNLFLIDMSIKYFKMILSQVMAYTLLFSTISSTISISQLGISESETPALYKGVQYTFIAASTLSTLLIGYVKLFKVQESLDTNTGLYKQWLTFSTRISSEFQMPVHMRASALELLQAMKNEYIELFCKNANIPFPVQRSANLYFQRNLGATAIRHGCLSRPNYIKRTNVFFIFQDIIKNEIKRLSAELTPITYDYDDEYDDVVPSYYGGKGQLNRSQRQPGPMAIIEYKYDGPFIVIDVKDRNDSPAVIRQKIQRRRQKMQRAASSQPQQPSHESEGRRKSILGRMMRHDTEDEEVVEVPTSRRERQMSFSLPERTIIQQSNAYTTTAQQQQSQHRSYYGGFPVQPTTIRTYVPDVSDATDEEIVRHQHIAAIAAATAAAINPTSPRRTHGAPEPEAAAVSVGLDDII